MSRTLVVVLGQTRAHELTFELFKKNVLDHLGADLCFCGEEPTNQNPFVTEAKYAFTITQPETSWDLLDNASKEILKDAGKEPSIHWSKYINIPGQIFMGGTKNGDSTKQSFLLYYRWILLKNMRSNGLLEKYDRFIITRSDFMWPFKHPNMHLLDPMDIWVPDGECYGGITDRHAVLSRHNVEEYLNIFNMMVLRPKKYIEEIFNLPTQFGAINIEMLISFHLSQNGFRCIKTIPYNMFTVRYNGGPTSWSTGEYNQELGYCVKYRSEYEETALFCYKLKKFNKTLPEDYYKFDSIDVGCRALVKGLCDLDDPTEYYNTILRGCRA